MSEDAAGWWQKRLVPQQLAVTVRLSCPTSGAAWGSQGAQARAALATQRRDAQAAQRGRTWPLPGVGLSEP